LSKRKVLSSSPSSLYANSASKTVPINRHLKAITTDDKENEQEEEEEEEEEEDNEDSDITMIEMTTAANQVHLHNFYLISIIYYLFRAWAITQSEQH
jgi:hypothetical protein